MSEYLIGYFYTQLKSIGYKEHLETYWLESIDYIFQNLNADYEELYKNYGKEKVLESFSIALQKWDSENYE